MGEVLTQRSRGAEKQRTWPMVRLGDVCEVQRGVRVTRKELSSDGKFNVYQNSLKPLGKYDSYNCEGNNPFMIMALAAGEVGFSAQPFWAADDCTYFRNLDALDNKFLYFILLANKRELQRNIRQTTIPRLSNKFLESLEIPLPPLDVQREIVERLEKELGEADKVAANFKKMIEFADAEFKAELDETFKALENGEGEFLTRIPRAEGESRSDALAGVRSRGAEKHGAWPMVRLGDVCEVRAGSTHHGIESAEGKYPVYGSGGYICHATEFRCPANSVTIGRKGTLDNPLLIEEPFWNIDTCFGCTPNDLLDPRYLWRFCQNFDFYNLVPSLGRPSTNSEAIRAIQIPLPPLDVQREIVERLEKELGEIEKLKAAAERGLRAAENLRKAILAEAFE